ncbi:MAG TPA: HEAT repeat domain-containing protein, partial [Planctomycetota bacterium]|nr:HEAT repeat domain-containing protein [Planctomycetota bacterium]
DVYRRLAADNDALVRKALVAVKISDASLQAEILSTLSRDSVQQVTAAVDDRLQHTDWTAGTVGLIAVVRARLENSAAPLQWLPQGLVRVPAARAEVTGILLRTADERLISVLGESMISKGRTGEPTVREDSFIKDWVTLPGADMARLVPLLQRISPLLLSSLANAAISQMVDSSVPAALDPFVADASQPLADRIYACAITLHDPTPARCARLLTLLSDPSLREGTAYVQQDNWLVAIAIKNVPPEQRNAVIRDVLRGVALRDDLALTVAGEFNINSPQATEVAPLILDRWLDGGSRSTLPCVQSAIALVGRTSGLASEDLMRRALHSPMGYGESAVTAMGRLRDPRFLDLLRECLDPTWYSGDGPALSASAINALQGYMNDEAAAVLLDAAANSPSSKVRTNALEAVEAIGRYRDALAAWQRRSASGATRDAAIVKLAGTVADKKGPEDVRAEAVRALGVLQAAEQLPLIIEALTDNSRDVREAAREALNRINAAVPAPAPAKPKPPAEPESEPENP